jgi:hypothetical protein
MTALSCPLPKTVVGPGDLCTEAPAGLSRSWDLAGLGEPPKDLVSLAPSPIDLVGLAQMGRDRCAWPARPNLTLRGDPTTALGAKLARKQRHRCSHEDIRLLLCSPAVQCRIQSQCEHEPCIPRRRASASWRLFRRQPAAIARLLVPVDLGAYLMRATVINMRRLAGAAGLIEPTKTVAPSGSAWAMAITCSRVKAWFAPANSAAAFSASAGEMETNLPGRTWMRFMI